MRWVRGVVGHVMLYFVPDGLDWTVRRLTCSLDTRSGCRCQMVPAVKMTVQSILCSLVAGSGVQTRRHIHEDVGLHRAQAATGLAFALIKASQDVPEARLPAFCINESSSLILPS